MKVKVQVQLHVHVHVHVEVEVKYLQLASTDLPRVTEGGKVKVTFSGPPETFNT